jgi:MoxR-like ATPase
MPAAEREMLDHHGSTSPLDNLQPVARASDVQDLVVAVRGVLVSDQVKDYIISLANATRNSPELRLGASPRATLHLLRASRAWAALDGRDYVIPDDVQRLPSSSGTCPSKSWTGSSRSCRCRDDEPVSRPGAGQ